MVKRKVSILAAVILTAASGMWLIGRGHASGTLIFDSAYATKGLSAYSNIIHKERISVIDDPILGAKRKVVKMAVDNADLGPTDNPRAQMETSQFWNAGQDYYVGYSLMVPPDFPNPPATINWFNVGEVYGPPFNGGGPNKLLIKRGWPTDKDLYLSWERNQNYNFDRPFKIPMPRGAWVDLVMHVKLAASGTSPAGGYWEVWTNTGSGYKPYTFDTGSTRFYSTTIDATNNGGANYDKISAYREKDMFPGTVLTYFADHKVGTSFDVVAPNSYPGVSVVPSPSPSSTPTPIPAGLLGDVNHDTRINALDLSALLSKWGSADAGADLNHDGSVNILDLSILVSHWTG